MSVQDSITILDSSDEDASSSKKLRNTHDKKLNSKTGSFEKQSMLKENKTINNNLLISVPVFSFVIQQFSIVPTSNLEILNDLISITYANGVLVLRCSYVKCVELSPCLSEPCLYFSVLKKYWKKICCQLELISLQSDYICPISSGDDIYILFYINKSWFESNHQKLRKQLMLQKNLFKEITECEGNKRQQMIAEAAFCDTVKNDQELLLPSSSRVFNQKIVQTYSSSKPKHISTNRNERNKTLAIYPPPPSSGGIVITNKDLRCLDERQFLNDVIIDFYLKYLMNEILSDEDRERSYVFSSFFYSRLVKNLDTLGTTQKEQYISASEERYLRVRNWSKKVDIFSKQLVFIPINDAAHWYLAVIYFPENVQGNTGFVAVTEPCILIFNSMQGSEKYDMASYLRGRDLVLSSVLETLLVASVKNASGQLDAQSRYLNEEWKNRKASSCGKRWFDEIRCFTPRVPQQNNHYDCGVFLLHYVEKVFENFIQNSETFSIKWFPSSEIKEKRNKIKKIIQSLHLQQSASLDVL